jgi:membrane associated rhomboid family serine protease
LFPLRDNIPTQRFPAVTIVLLLANVLAYFLWQKGGILHGPDDAHVIDYGWIPYEIKHPGQQCIAQGNAIACGEVPGQPSVWVTAFTSMFMHGSVVHLAGNMLFLWIFGNNVEDHLGHIGFTVFYFVVGVAAMAAHYLADPGSTQPVIGASGAIAGVMGAYLVFWPRARVLSVIALLFFLPVYLPAAVLLAIWFGSQFVTSFNPNSGVAWVAHVGGFVAGAGIALALRGLFGPPRQRVRPAGPPQWGWGR